MRVPVRSARSRMRYWFVLLVAVLFPAAAPAKDRPAVESLLTSAVSDPANVLIVVETKRAAGIQTSDEKLWALFPVAGISVDGRKVTVPKGTFVITECPTPNANVSSKALAKALLKSWKGRETENAVVVGSYLLTFAIGELEETRTFEVEEVVQVAKP